MSGLLDGLLSAPPAVVYVLVGLLVFGEAAVFVGFVLPGETAVVLGGVLASRHEIDLRSLVALVVALRDHRRHRRVRGGPALRRPRAQLAAAAQARGRLDGARALPAASAAASAVFLGRWTAFLRAVMPGLAGVSQMPYRRFILWNALGGIAWGTTFCLVGYLAGTPTRWSRADRDRRAP